MFCDQCGTPLSEQAKFCPNCGAPRASAPKVPTIAPKADTASTAAQADAQSAFVFEAETDAQSTFVFEAETDAKNAQPSGVTPRKDKKNTKKGEKTRQPLRAAPKRLWAWFKSRRLPIKILLCVALVVAFLALGILTNLLWDYTLHKQELPCPDPVDYFSLIETDGKVYTGFMDEDTSLEAIRAYRILLQTKYNADVTLSEDNKEQHRYVLDIELNRWSLFGNVRRTLTVTYQDSDATWYIEKGWSFQGRVKFVPVEPYQAETTTSGKTTEQQNTVTVPESSSSDTAGNETTAAQENETAAPTEPEVIEQQDNTPTEPEVAEEIVLEGAVVPDFSAFCNNLITVKPTVEEVDYTIYRNYWCYNGKAQAEYIELLRSYGFELRDSYSNSDTDEDMYVFDYIGTEDVGTFDAPYTYPKKLDKENVSLVIDSLHIGSVANRFEIVVADGVTYADTGDRTTRELTPYYGEDAAASSSSSSGVVESDSNWDKSVLDCFTCRGSGKCNHCAGYGFIYKHIYVDGGAQAQIQETCSYCHKSGICRTCGGSGKR